MKKIFSFFVLEYLKFFAKLKLAQIRPIIIGVTGSAGKSSCVAAIEAILKSKYRVKTTGTANSESGIPLSILGLQLSNYSLLDWLRVVLLAPLRALSTATSKFQILICEMGIDSLQSPKNMSYLLTIVRPKIGVFLNALPVHTEQMGSVENIFAEKSKLIKSLPADGFAVVNSQFPPIPTLAKVIKFKDDGSPAPPAIAVGKIFGLSATKCRQLLAKNLTLPPGRWSIFEGINGSLIIDSSYNSSPVPAILALNKLRNFQPPPNSKFQIKRRLAVLGDMRELGALAESQHQKVAAIAKKCADEVITVGPLWKKFTQLPHQFDNWYQTGKFLQSFLQEGDLVLFKGSQNTIFLEGAVEMVLKKKGDAAKLCRRGKYWGAKRKQYAQD